MKSTWKWEAMMSFLSLSLIEFSFFAANTSCVLPWWFVGAEGKGWNCPLASEDYRKSTDNGTKLNSWPQSLPNILSTGHETLLKTAAVFFYLPSFNPLPGGKGKSRWPPLHTGHCGLPLCPQRGQTTFFFKTRIRSSILTSAFLGHFEMN